jgi:2-polyprenyl-3-methyl-5-hydroxy-6-metoxy-1,4-benzoquinol methylase
MRIVAIYKTWDGGEFVDASLASIYDHVENIVMVHSELSWLGERGNTVKQAAVEWCNQFDKAGKIHHINVELTSQEEQYAAGLDFISKHRLGDVVMVVDADEVWEGQYIENARMQISDNPKYPAYRCNMHTYIKSPFYRVNPPYGSPMAFFREPNHLTLYPRGHKAPAMQLSDVWMHHFTAVRETREAVERKIRQSCLADKSNEQIVPDWMTKVYDRLPAGQNLHYFVRHQQKWLKVEKITEFELPPAMLKAKLISQWWVPTPPPPPPVDEVALAHAAVMNEAARIHDVAKRHAFVFDSGHSCADFFDVDKRMGSEEFSLLKKHVKPEQDVIEVGCYTGLNLIGLARLGHTGNMTAVDFVQGAIDWLKGNWPSSAPVLTAICREFPNFFDGHKHDVAICFDVLEHQRNQGQFLEAVSEILNPDGVALILVPARKEYYDCGHVGFFPDAECLRNVLDYVFDVEECYELASCNKLFALCRKRKQ